MNNDLLDLANSLEKLADELDAKGIALSVKFSKELLKNLISLSPVDTSQLISNWVVTLNIKSPDSQLIPPYFLGKKGSTKSVSGDEAIAKGNSVLDEAKPGDIIYITNVAPQVIYTNYGTSKIEPRYFVENAISAAKSAITVNNLDITLKATL